MNERSRAFSSEQADWGVGQSLRAFRASDSALQAIQQKRVGVGGDRLDLDDWSEEKTLHRTPALPAKHVQRVCRSGRCRVGGRRRGSGRAKSSLEVDGERPRKAGGGQVPDLLRPNRIAHGQTIEDECLLHEETPFPADDASELAMVQKRVDKGDADAIYMLGNK
ncbi:hypothetical protein THAOC_28695, partial [Thalassiosira oceanica]